MSKKKKLKCIIAGSRTVNDLNTVNKAVEASGFKDDIVEVVSGTAYGVDKTGELWAKQHNLPVKQFSADWSNIDVPGAIVRENAKGKYNAKAGFDRNQKMAEYADVLVAVMEDNSSGTEDMIQRMSKLEKPFYVWEV